MTNEEKGLLLKDLCGRLPYGVMCEYTFMDGRKTDMVFKGQHFDHEVICKPYLRPISSMTEEEKKEYHSILDFREKEYGNEVEYFCMETDIHDCFDFLNSHHLDYRGLIPKRLALEAPEGMYN